MLSYYSIFHEHTDAYNSSIFYRLVVSPLPVCNNVTPFLLPSFSYKSIYDILSFSIIWYSCLPVPQYFPVIFYWCIIIFLSSAMLSILTMSSIIVFFYGNNTAIYSDVLDPYLGIFRSIISILNFSPRIPLTKSLLLVVIEVFFSETAINMVLYTTPYTRVRRWETYLLVVYLPQIYFCGE